MTKEGYICLGRWSMYRSVYGIIRQPVIVYETCMAGRLREEHRDSKMWG